MKLYTKIKIISELFDAMYDERDIEVDESITNLEFLHIKAEFANNFTFEQREEYPGGFNEFNKDLLKVNLSVDGKRITNFA